MKRIKTNWICLVLIYSVGIYSKTSVLETFLTITGKWQIFKDREWYGNSSHMEKVVEFRCMLLRWDWPKGQRVFFREHFWLSPAWTEKERQNMNGKSSSQGPDILENLLEKLWFGLPAEVVMQSYCLLSHCSAACHKEDRTNVKS